MSELITLLIAVASAISCGPIRLQESSPDVPKSLQDGEYLITITSPDVPKDRRTVSHRIRFKVDAKTGKIKGELLRTLDGKPLPPLPMHGLKKGTTLKFAVSDVENGALITFHFSGKSTDAENASGSLICFRDLEKVLAGKWTLSKSNK